MNAREAALAYRAALVLSRQHTGAVVTSSQLALGAMRNDTATALLRALPASDRPVDAVFLGTLDSLLVQAGNRLGAYAGDAVEYEIRTVVEGTFEGIEMVTVEALESQDKDARVASGRLNNQAALTLAAILTRSDPEPPRGLIGRRVRDIITRLRAWVRAVGNAGTRKLLLDTVVRTIRGLPVDPEVRTLTTRLLRGETMPTVMDRIAMTEAWNALLASQRDGATASGLIQLGRWTLSPWHDETDICDDIAEYNSGYGPGWYPVQVFPTHPHPRCACTMQDVRTWPVERWQ